MLIRYEHEDTHNLTNVRHGTRIYILYNFKLYKLKIIIYVPKYVSDSFGSKKIFFMIGSKEFVPYFYNYNKNLYNKIKFLETIVFIPFKIVLEPC